MTLRGALTLLGQHTTTQFPPSISSKSSWLTNWTRTQAGSLFNEAVEIRHLLIQGTERRVFALHGFNSKSLAIFRVLAYVMDTELRNLGYSVSRE